MSFDINIVTDRFSRRFRKKRLEQALRMMKITPSSSVLDVGGTLFNWNLVGFTPRLTIVNLAPAPSDLPSRVTWVRADGRCLPFAEKSFEICFSNSVIEHIGTWEDQEKFAREVKRVAQRYYVQTPNYWFPIEPHLVAPFIHWLPPRWQRRLIRHFTLFGIMSRPTPEVCELLVAETRLLRRREMSILFEGARIEAETLLGLRKSIIAIAPELEP